MNDRLTPQLNAEAGMLDVFAAQQHAFKRQPYPSAAERRANLRTLKRQLHRYQDLLADAMSRDFGFRAHPNRRCSTCSARRWRSTTRSRTCAAG